MGDESTPATWPAETPERPPTVDGEAPERPPTVDGEAPDGDAVLAVQPRLLADAPLGGEFDDYGEQEDAVAFARVAGFPSEDEANEVGRHLVEHGVGATVTDEVEAGNEVAPDDRYGIYVLPDDLRRAAEVLGLVAAQDRPEASPAETIAVDRGPIPWKKVLPIWLAAMIILPLAAFYLTYLVMSR